LPARQAAQVVQKLAAAVGFAHRQTPPIVHRDLKPANILVQRSADGKVALRVADFGIGGVAASQAIEQTNQGTSRGQVMVSALRGSYTPLYASPQQIQGEPPDPRDDVYALGVIWYQLLTGELAAGRPGGSAWKKRLADKGTPDSLIALLEACIEDDVADRPGNGVVLAERLAELLSTSSQPGPVAGEAKEQLTGATDKSKQEEEKRGPQPAPKVLAQSQQGVMPIPLCSHCHAELGPEVTDTCPSCGMRPWANTQFRRQEQGIGEDLRAPAAAAPAAPTLANVAHLPPELPPDVPQFYMAARGQARGDMEYRPRVLGVAEVVFVIDKHKGLQRTHVLRLLAEAAEAGYSMDWDHAEPAPQTLVGCPSPQGRWAEVPSALDSGRKLKALEKTFSEWVYGSQRLPLLQNSTLGLVSAPGESLEAFRARCRAAAMHEAEKALEMEKAKFAPKFEALGMRVPGESVQKQGGFWSWLTGSETPASRSASGPPSSRQEEKERKLKADYQSKRNEIGQKWYHAAEEVSPIEVKPRRSDVRVTLFGLAWAPYWVAVGIPAVAAYR
jgi:hypothetical protein